MVSHKKKSHVAPNFSCLDLRNAMVPLTTLLASCHTTTGGNDVSDQKVMLHLMLTVIDLRITMVPLMTSLASCDTNANPSCITSPIKSRCTSVVQ